MSSASQKPAPTRSWWHAYLGDDESPFDADASAWGISLLIHVVVLLSLALVALQEPPRPEASVTIIQPRQVVDEELVLAPEELVVADIPRDTAGAESEASAEVAQALAPMLAEESVAPVEADTDMVTDLTVEPLDVVATAAASDGNFVVKGAVGVGATGAAGAVDRLTAEIAATVSQRPTVVCWVFDQSVSLAGQRKEIAARLERVFEELDENLPGTRKPDLKNMVVAYGQKATLVTKATEDWKAVAKAIESIPVDDSGIEMTFTAVRKAAEEARVFRTSAPRRNVMIIVFTDEVGNDQDQADATAKYCSQLGMRVYVVGVPSPFGMKDVKIKFVEFDPKYAQEPQWAVVEQGPETLYPEVVRVHSGRLTDEAIDSGFGPFSLSRLCAETGGIYFSIHANRGAAGRVGNDQTAAMASQLRYFFDPEVMRDYQPDYVAAATINKQLTENKAKKALVDAARSTEITPMESPEMVFPRKDDASLAQLLGEAQKTAARIQPRLDELERILRAGQSDRDKIAEKRWQAGYDLSLGRVLAVKTRTDAYNATLAQAKAGMKFKDPKSDTWVLEESDDLSKVGSQTEKIAQQAKALLQRVEKEHPGTPWALLASEELKRPLGYVWKERHTGVNEPKKPGTPGNNGTPGARADDKKRMMNGPKPTRTLKNI
jgi:hypothetical protein